MCLCEYTDHGHCGVIENGEIAKRPDAGNSGAAGAVSCAGGSRHCRSLGHDGRPRRRRFAASWMTTILKIFRSWLTRRNIVPDFTDRFAKRRSPRPVWRPAQLPDGSGEWPRSDEGSGAGSGRRRGHRDGEAGAALPGYHSAWCGISFDVPVAAYNVSGEYSMVKAAAREWLDRRKTGRAGNFDGNSAGRRGNYSDLPRQRCGSLVEILR